MREKKRLWYFDSNGQKQAIDFDLKEYERLVQNIGVDFETEGQECINILVKVLKNPLPSNWARERDLDDSIVYFNSDTHEITKVHPFAFDLRKLFKIYFESKINTKNLTKIHQKGAIVPDSSKKYLDLIKKRIEKDLLRKKQMEKNSSLKVVIGSSLAQKLLK